MAEYEVYAKLVVRFESPRTPAQIRSALALSDPTLRQALKAAWRSQLQKDPTGQTVPVSWHYHASAIRIADDVTVDLDDGGPIDEPEP